MKYLYSWLKDYYKTDETAEQIAENLVALGSDVDDISGSGELDEKIITAKILEIKPHPNADRLKLAKVSTGDDEAEIVCGAPNIEVGQIVPLAQVGTRLGEVEIKEAEIRGVKSAGMLCSAKELGLGDDHEGIYILQTDYEIGQPLKNYLKSDSIFDLEITPNRGDLLSHFGLSRDLSAKMGKNLEKEKIDFNESNDKASDFVQVESKTELCPLYLARVIRGVKIASSPDWLQKRLLAVGAKPINNVVDATNYIMLDLGHPLHAFDAKKIDGHKIEIREIEADTEVVTLDGEARELISGMVVIADGEKPVAIAGVMGLKNSEVDEGTTDIILEAAVFERKSIRKTAKLLGLKTEASARFERGVDAAGVQYAIGKAAKIIQEIGGGEILQGAVSSQLSAVSCNKIKVEYEKINSFADLNLSNEQIDKILQNLGFEIENGQATIPSWRHDIEIWQDLAEEIYRINGLKKIKPVALPQLQPAEPSDYYKKEKIKDFLVEQGLDEIISYTFLSEVDAQTAGLKTSELLEVANPVQDENRYLRNSLIPGLLKAVAKNPSFDDIEIFELGSVFSKTDEWMTLGIATAGSKARKAEKIVDELCQKFGFDKGAFRIYEINEDELKRFKIKKPAVFVAEAKITDLLAGGKFTDLSLAKTDKKIIYRPISKFPPVNRDLAFVVDEKTDLFEIRNSIFGISPKAILVEPFDEFICDKFGAGKKSVAFHIWLEDLGKTLSLEEADGEISKIVSELAKKFEAKLRD